MINFKKIHTFMGKKNSTLTSPIGCRLAFFFPELCFWAEQSLFKPLAAVCICHCPLGCSVLQWGSVPVLLGWQSQRQSQQAPLLRGGGGGGGQQLTNTAAELNKVLREQWHLLTPSMENLTDIKSCNRCICVYAYLPWWNNFSPAL